MQVRFGDSFYKIPIPEKFQQYSERDFTVGQGHLQEAGKQIVGAMKQQGIDADTFLFDSKTLYLGVGSQAATDIRTVGALNKLNDQRVGGRGVEFSISTNPLRDSLIERIQKLAQIIDITDAWKI